MPRLSKIGAAALGAFGWTGISVVSASYLVIAGGGGGGMGRGGGGGAGGYLTGTTSLNPTLSYTVTVGAGGAGSTINSSPGTSGSNSVFNAITSTGGGGGGSAALGPGVTGGSGGGAGGAASGNTGASGTSGQGNAGGNSVVNNAGGGGGGSSSVGVAGSVAVGGNGGNGSTASSALGSGTYAGGGGGGAGGTGSPTAGTGQAGGGNGGGSTGNGSNATANTGSGGGGGGDVAPRDGGAGGSGVVLISYLGAQQFGGGVVTSSGGYTIHTFNTSGTLAPLSSLTASYLIVAGGGGGGGYNNGAGGGAGGLLSGSGLTIDTNSTYAITVGAGGAGGAAVSGTAGRGTSGSNSTFSIYGTSAVGGGGGGDWDGGSGGIAGLSGGSGGGGGAVNGTAGSGTSGQGNNGGAAAASASGGGGGAGAVGSAGTGGGGTGVGGAGGIGSTSSISGTSTYYAGGGGGGGNLSSGAGGSGGGAAGSFNGTAASGTANLGGGGGGVWGGTAGGAGGSGIVIISYAGATQLMAGGTVTISGGNVIHTFTSSGYLTPLKLVSNSLRFSAYNNGYLSRTPTVAGNRKTWTLSAWVKRGKLGSINTILNAGYSTIPWFVVNFGSDDTLQIAATAGSSASWKTAAVFRDPAAWYHVVAVVDTTSATTTITSTSTDRMRLYVNGVQYALTSGTVPTQNSDLQVNNTISHTIGGYSGEYFDGYMAEVNLIDGQALTPYSFGTYNSYGVWQPITYGGSYGTNGFYLNFNASQSSSYYGSFSGSPRKLTVPSASQFNVGSSDFTVEAWIYIVSNAAATNRPILSQSVSGAASNSSYFFGVGSDGLALYLSTSGTSWTDFLQTTNGLQVSTWYHVAFQRSGNTLQAYLNGILQGQIAFSGTVFSSSRVVDIAAQSTTSYFNGRISNLRFVNGTAVYTSNFTPPTANLSSTQVSGIGISAITGTATSLLTLQNSSITDTSSYASTITNVGSVTTSFTYPFVVSAFNDQSAQNNNWTPNNIFTGSTNATNMDFVNDSPTLTSTRIANYCVMNPLDKNASATIIGSNLIQDVSASTWRAVRSTYFVSSGKWYWETTLNGSGSDTGMLGVSKASASLGAIPDANAWGYNGTNGQKYTNSTNSAYGSTYASADIIGIALDMDAGTITFYVNNTSQGTAFTGLSGLLSPTFWQYAGYQWFVNFGQQPFTYTPPSGYLALNTYNI